MHLNPTQFHRGQTRRHFIKTAGLATAVAGSGLFQLPLYANEGNRNISILVDPSDTVAKEACVQWALKHLQNTLEGRGVKTHMHERIEQVPPSHECILASGPLSVPVRRIFEAANILLPDGPESLALARGKIRKRRVTAIAGSDAAGLMYAILELADRMEFSNDPLDELRLVRPVSERPANKIRSIMRVFASNVQDKSWFNDRRFWQSYLTTLATHRFNRFNLAFGLGYDFTSHISDCYFHFAYPFLVSVPGYDVRAVPLSDAERDHNLEMLQFISREAARRGLHFQLGIWTHAYKWTDSPHANYRIEGLTPETQASYCRDALRTLLQACPAISGVTIRTHGESGVPEGDYGFWKKVFAGAAQCGRRVEIDLHAKGLNQRMIDVALDTGLPVNVSPKFWAEHMGLPYMQGSIRAMERPPKNLPKSGFFELSAGSRSFTRYGYADFLTADRRYGVLHRMWPGTQRMLLWADHKIAAGYGHVSSFCDSNGVELFEPLSFKGRKGSGLPGGRNAYADTTLRPDLDFEKFSCTYRVWGQNLYNPDGDPDGWQRKWRHEFGRAAHKVEQSLTSAGRILPLVTVAHCPSAANNNYWPEMYTNISISDPNRPNPYFDTPKPKVLGTVSPLDPEFFLGIDEFVAELINEKCSGKYSPIWVARRLEEAGGEALARLHEAKSRVRNPRSVHFRRLAIDILMQAGLGRFFAARFRAGVLYGLYQRSGHRPALEEAVKLNRTARDAWAELAGTAKVPYLPDITYGPEYFQRGHWLDRLQSIDDDTADLEKLLKEPSKAETTSPKADKQTISRAMRIMLDQTPEDRRPSIAIAHTPPSTFERDKSFPIVAHVSDTTAAKITSLVLRYRQINQAELWREIGMEMTGNNYHAVIPAEYTDSPFHLQYYFRIRFSSGDAWLYPGLEQRWQGQPYFFVCQS